MLLGHPGNLILEISMLGIYEHILIRGAVADQSNLCTYFMAELIYTSYSCYEALAQLFYQGGG